MDALEVLRLIWSLKNRLAPINRIPPEILALIPEPQDIYYKDKDLIALTHVCRAWREIFVSYSSLWTNFDCSNADKTRVYLERSKSSPINLSLRRDDVLPPGDPFLQVVPHLIGRLKSLSIAGRFANPQDRVPLLEWLDADSGSSLGPSHQPIVTTLFEGDLSSLRELYLQSVRTELPWRNMVNLTSLTLSHMSPSDLSITQLLDFFEGAPRLCDIILTSATPTTGGQDGRLVSLGCLKKMDILLGPPSSLFLDHLLIPVGAKLERWVDSFHRVVEDHLPRSLDNLRNISNFTKVRLQVGAGSTRMKLSGTNGQFCIASLDGTLCSALGSLARLDTSKVERLEVVNDADPYLEPPYQQLLPLKCLRTLTLSRCANLDTYLEALHPNTSLSKVMACPELGKLTIVLRTDGEFDPKFVIGITAARAARGAKFGTVRIVGGQDRLDPGDVLELRKHISHVEYGPEAVDSDSDGSDEEY